MTRTSTRVRGPRGNETLKLNRSPCSTPAGHRHRQALLVQLLAAAVARLARFAPHFAAAAAARAGARHADVERHHRAGAGLIGGDRDLSVRRSRRPVRLDMIAAEKLDRRAGRGKINRHFVGKRPPIRALVGHERFERNTRRVGSPGTKHLAATIEAACRGCQETTGAR